MGPSRRDTLGSPLNTADRVPSCQLVASFAVLVAARHALIALGKIPVGFRADQDTCILAAAYTEVDLAAKQAVSPARSLNSIAVAQADCRPALTPTRPGATTKWIQEQLD